MLRPTVLLLLATTAATLEAQLTPEQRAARERPAGGPPIWASPGGDRSTPLTTWEYHVRALRAQQAQRAMPDLRRPGERYGLTIVTGVHWMTLTPVDATSGSPSSTWNRLFTIKAGEPTRVTISPRRASPGTVAIIALRIDNEDGTRHWSATPTSTVDAARVHTLALPALPRGSYLLTVEVFNTEEPGIPESRSVNQLRVD